MRLVAWLWAASVVCALFGFCVGVASANPWNPGKNKLPRLSSKPQNASIEHIHVTNGAYLVRKRRGR
jgi:hypothetical protein